MNDLTLAGVIGILTVIFGVLVKIIGFPDQMMKNYRRKSTEGISKTFYALSFTTYCLWTLHGYFQKDLVLMFGQGLGVVTTGVILYQITIYKKDK